MISSIASLQQASTQEQTEQAVQPPKTLQTQPATQNTDAQDTVTISQEARLALASNTKMPSGADVNPSGDSH